MGGAEQRGWDRDLLVGSFSRAAHAGEHHAACRLAEKKSCPCCSLSALLLLGSHQWDQHLELLQPLTPAPLAEAKRGWSQAVGWGPSLPLGTMR